MLSGLKAPAPDKILALTQMFREDPRDAKIDLGVGVYRTPEGVTPVMRAVKAAEKRIWDEQTTKSYTGLAGDPAYARGLAGMILGEGIDPGRTAAIATPGGTGAVRQAFELVKAHGRADATVWVSDPTWPNHITILRHMEMPTRTYRYFDDATCKVDVEGMLADLAEVAEGDIVLLHGCCHNPTGANLTAADWTRVADLLAERGATPMIDIAYQGFGDGLDADAAGTRLLAERLPEVLIAASCSKNFGIYRERAGLLLTVSDASEAGTVQLVLNALNRANYSFPPDHGPRIVATILGDADLRADWQAELEETRLSMLALRRQLADELRQRTNSSRYDFIADHRGMFSRLGASPDEVAKMREDFGIYMVGDSRLNIAGLNADTVPVLARAIAQTCA
ncbi:aspartate/tyrosine/aromatic aminotransferase [Mesobaculum littorinae]|uniref:Aminotransferase n=1 Tax=Mesobaculum littorinae TaxID=2486419 RepID=A0A438AI59_9RHOB|nr:amino acid aminotransferase [Mesobaculum littorinae]RVV98390.1 aspartate/tyrosine/aromatic aminotransferase [Mesobaculum littorinae]